MLAIDAAIAQSHLRAALKLFHCFLDQMGYLSMPENVFVNEQKH